LSHPKLNPLFNSAEFLREYWQQRPLLLPELVQFTDPLSPEELAGLACEEGVESRLVQGNEDWRLRHGPFQEADFTELSASCWTLLIHGVDLYINEFRELRDLFKFIPNWRLDDVMASYAAPAGGVGPHFDYYDVFLVQGSGQRRWQLGKRHDPAEPVQSESGLMLLADFEPEEEYVLNPGDVLYIPPQYGHWGTAVTESFCYSVGFRAPSTAEMLEGFSDALIARSDPARRFTNLASKEPPKLYEIGIQDLKAAFSLMQQEMADFANFSKWFGAYMTQPKYPELFPGVEELPNADALRGAIEQNEVELLRNPASRMAYTLAGDEQTMYFFVDGRVYKLSSAFAELIIKLCEPSFSFSELFSSGDLPEAIQDLVLDMLAEGSLLLEQPQVTSA